MIVELLREEIALLNEDLRLITEHIRELESGDGGKSNRLQLQDWRRREKVTRNILSRTERELELLQWKFVPAQLEPSR